MNFSQIIEEGRDARDRNVPDYGCPYWVLNRVADHDTQTQEQIWTWINGYRARDYEIAVADRLLMDAATKIIPLVYVEHRHRADLKRLGEAIALCDSQEGLPAEMAFTEVEETTALTTDEKVVVMFWYTAEAIKHRQNSILGWKRYRQLQQQNWKIALEVLRTGKFSSVYHMLT